MTYRLTRFGYGLDLPEYEATLPLGNGPARLGLVDLPGGLVFDADFSLQAGRGKNTISYKGTLTAADITTLGAAWAAWQAAVGKRDYLIRLNADGSYHRMLARMAEAKADRKAENLGYLETTLDFVTLRAEWYGSNTILWYLDSGEYLDSGLVLDGTGPQTITSPATFVLTNNGNLIVRNVLMMITAGDAAITAVKIEKAGETEINYSGSIGAGDALVIDCGAMTVENDGSDDYAHFSLGAGHVIEDWIRLAAGSNSIVITITGGGTGPWAWFKFFDAWA